MMSEAWDWGYTNCRPKTSKPRKPGQNTQKDGKTSTTCCITSASLTSGNHPNVAHQQAPQRPTSRPFWNRENTRTFFQEILLANTPPWCRELRKGMQYMPGLESSSAHALWWLTIFAGAYPPLERFIDRFCHWSTNFDGLDGRHL